MEKVATSPSLRCSQECAYRTNPNAWEQRKLGEVAEIVGGGTPNTGNPEYWDGDINWFAPAEIGDVVYVGESVRKITEKGYAACSATMLPADKTILFTSRAGIGNTAILRRSACTNQGFQSLVVNDGCDVYFVYSATPAIKKWAEIHASGSTFLEISGKVLAGMPVRTPSLSEQRLIGTLFRHYDDLITLRQREQSIEYRRNWGPCPCRRQLNCGYLSITCLCLLVDGKRAMLSPLVSAC